MKTQELNNDELKNVNGGGLLGGDDSMIKGVLQGSIETHDTDRDGKTRSSGIDFGLGSLLDSQND